PVRPWVAISVRGDRAPRLCVGLASSDLGDLGPLLLDEAGQVVLAHRTTDPFGERAQIFEGHRDLHLPVDVGESADAQGGIHLQHRLAHPLGRPFGRSRPLDHLGLVDLAHPLVPAGGAGQRRRGRAARAHRPAGTVARPQRHQAARGVVLVRRAVADQHVPRDAQVGAHRPRNFRSAVRPAPPASLMAFSAPFWLPVRSFSSSSRRSCSLRPASWNRRALLLIWLALAALSLASPQPITSPSCWCACGPRWYAGLSRVRPNLILTHCAAMPQRDYEESWGTKPESDSDYD